MEIDSIKLRKIFDSRGKESVEAEINGSKGRASAEILDMPEHLEAVEKKLERLEERDLTQQQLDEELEEIDGTGKFSSLGCVAPAVSLAFKNSSGYSYSGKFPLPISCIVGKSVDSGSGIKQMFVVPAGARTFPEAVETNMDIYKEFRDRYDMKIQGLNSQGAFVTSMDDEKALRSLKKVAEDYGARIGLNMDGESIYRNEKYRMMSLGIKNSPEQHRKFVQKLIDELELAYIEDPFHSEDFYNHARLTSENPESVISGNSIFSGDRERLEEGVENGACNAITFGLGKAGTLTSAREAVETAREKDYISVIASDTGNGPDEAVPRAALEMGASAIKTGIGGIETEKLNQLIGLWERMEDPEMNEL